MAGKNKIESKHLGLEIGSILSLYFFEKEVLHFGYWPDGLKVAIMNLPVAQDNHSRFILDHFPIDAGRILDVGCGAGHFGRMMLDRGFEVDGVVPSPYLANRVREHFVPRCEIFECRFEDLHTDKQYDLVLFSESFQYVEMETALKKTAGLLKPDGHLVICDFFQRDVEGVRPVKGGHKWSAFQGALGKSPFRSVADFDITKETGRTLDLVNDFMMRVGGPIRDILAEAIRAQYPLLAKLGRWKLKKRLEKMKRKYFSGRMNSESFTRHKTYRLLIYRMQ